MPTFRISRTFLIHYSVVNASQNKDKLSINSADVQKDNQKRKKAMLFVSLILYLTGRICIFKLRGQKAYNDRHTDILIEIYNIRLYFYNIHIIYFIRFSVRSSISELEAVMQSDN